jgi:hypothetical protein
MIPMGLGVAAVAGGALALRLPLVGAAVAVTVLSVGYDMSHPLLAGIITSLDPVRRGQAMALNAFVLFMGFGAGPLVFEMLLPRGFEVGLGVFSGVLMAAGVVGVWVFRGEGLGVRRDGEKAH